MLVEYNKARLIDKYIDYPYIHNPKGKWHQQVIKRHYNNSGPNLMSSQLIHDETLVISLVYHSFNTMFQHLWGDTELFLFEEEHECTPGEHWSSIHWSSIQEGNSGKWFYALWWLHLRRSHYFVDMGFNAC